MQDDFDNGVEMPDDELAGEAAASEDLGDDLTAGGGEGHPRPATGMPAGRPSGGARAKSSSARKSSGARKPAKAAKKKAASAKKKSAAARKGSKKRPAKRSKRPAKRKAGAKK